MSINWPVPKGVVLLPCRTQMKLSFGFKHGSSKPFETIKRGTPDLSSARLLNTAGLAMQHGSSTACFQTAYAELNSQMNLMYFALFAYYYAGWMVCFVLN